MKKSINKTFKVCALCANWNGSIGSTSINIRPAGYFDIDNTEKHACAVTGFQKDAMSKCPKFSPRY